MKIALSGPQCCGKTTLINKLKKILEFKDYTFCDEIVRKIAKKGFKFNKAGDNDSQLLILNTHLEYLLTHKDMVTDRCLLDGFVYTMYNVKNSKTTDDWVFDYAINLFEQYVYKYDYIFYIPVEFDLVADGVRSVDKVFQSTIDTIFTATLQTHRLPNVVIVTGSVEERMKKILNTVDSQAI